MERVVGESAGERNPLKRPWHPPTVEEADYPTAEGGAPSVFSDGGVLYAS